MQHTGNMFLTSLKPQTHVISSIFKYLRPAQMEFETTKQPLAGERMGISPTRTGSQQPKNLTQSILLGHTGSYLSDIGR